MWPNPSVSAALRRDLEVTSAARDFARENARRIRDLAGERRRRAAEARVAEERRRRLPLKATQQFRHVAPRVRTRFGDGEGGSAVEGGKAFLRGHQKTGPFLASGRRTEEYSSRHQTPTDGGCGRVSVQDGDRDDVFLRQEEDERLSRMGFVEADQDEDEVWTVVAASSLRAASCRFSEVDVDERKERIDDILRDICATRPLLEGHRTRSFVGLHRSASLRSLRRSPSLTSMVSRSVQTEGETALGPSPVTVVPKDIVREGRHDKNQRSSRSRDQKRLMSRAKSTSDLSQRSATIDGVGDKGLENIPVGRKIKSRNKANETPSDDVTAVEDGVNELKLDLDGIEGAIDAQDQQAGEGGSTQGVGLPSLVRGVGMDYVSANRDGASLAGSRRRKEPPAKGREGSHEAGAVPTYLKRRKERWRKEEERREMDKPDPACPVGHVRLDREQQLRVLSKLQKEYEAALQDQVLIPVGSDTLRVRTMRRETEERLSKLDDAIRTYSRPVVYVKKDFEQVIA